MPATSDVEAALAAFMRQVAPHGLGTGPVLRWVASAPGSLLRDNPNAHLTCSALIVSPAEDRVVVIDHVTLGMVLPPGGHVERDDCSMLEAALREAREETGLPVAAHPWTLAHAAPIDVDSHLVPANPRRSEPEHVHHDFMYLLTADGEPVSGSPNEVCNARWLSFQEAAKVGGRRLERALQAACLTLLTATRPHGLPR